jgi:hypothetical protein
MFTRTASFIAAAVGAAGASDFQTIGIEHWIGTGKYLADVYGHLSGHFVQVHA